MYARTDRSPGGPFRQTGSSWREWIPPIQLKPTGQPISVADNAAAAIVLSLVFLGLAKLFGPSILF